MRESVDEFAIDFRLIDLHRNFEKNNYKTVAGYYGFLLPPTVKILVLKVLTFLTLHPIKIELTKIYFKQNNFF